MSKTNEFESLKAQYAESVIAARMAGENLRRAAGEGPAAIVAAEAAARKAAERRDAIEAQLKALDEEGG